MEEKLNAVVDKLARQYQDNFGSFRQTTNMFPSAPAVLKIKGTPITSHIRHHITKA